MRLTVLLLWKRGFPGKFAHLILFCPIKKHSFQPFVCFLSFSERWQSTTLFQIILLVTLLYILSVCPFVGFFVSLLVTATVLLKPLACTSVHLCTCWLQLLCNSSLWPVHLFVCVLVGYSYCAIHTFGRRLVYPGSTSLMQMLIGRCLLCLNVCYWFMYFIVVVLCT